MESYIYQSILLTLMVLPFFVSADQCLSPSVTSKVYTTTEATVASETVVIVELAVSCKNGIKGLNLYADFNGKTLPASKVAGTNKYQVSFSDGHKKIPSGSYNIRFFDEEGYSTLRKAQRSGEDVNAIKSLFAVDVDHPGASHGPWFQSEFVAATTGIVVWYTAYMARSRLQTV